MGTEPLLMRWKKWLIFMTSALESQVGGRHYADCKIQPIEYIHANGLDFMQGSVIKYVTRYKSKNKAADLRKAIHFLQLMLELEYGEKE